MQHESFLGDFTLKTFFSYLCITLALISVGLLFETQSIIPSSYAAKAPMPEELYGQYAPQGICSKEPVVTVSKKGVSIQYQGQKSDPLNVDICYSCAGGAQYNGIQRWVSVKEGKDRWGGTSPVTLMFNANEQKGRLEVTNPGALVVPVSIPLNAVVNASPLQLCTQNPQATSISTQDTTSNAATIFAKNLIQLMSPFSVPRDSFYDWRYLEKAPDIHWASLPPTMLDKPMSDHYYFQRKGLINVGSQPISIVAAGTHEMVMAFYILNQTAPLGESVVLSALQSAGASITTARCPLQANTSVPKWYRITAKSKHPAFLWIAPARGKAQPWEGFQFLLESTLPPMSSDERKVYSEKCPN
jgi:hypothetical protein